MATADYSTDSMASPAPPVIERLRFTRDDYYRMAEVGLIDPDAKVELLDGEIIKMSPAGPFHSGVTAMLTEFFICNVGDRFICRCQSPQATDEYSEPEPDLQLITRRADYYRTAHPTAADASLVIEVAQSSLAKDSALKMKIYAAAGIPEYWVVDLVNRQLIVHLQPDRDTAEYRDVTKHGEEAKIAPTAANDCVLDLAWLFGPRAAEA